jgi:hypothetical protein
VPWMLLVNSLLFNNKYLVPLLLSYHPLTDSAHRNLNAIPLYHTN